MPTNKNDIHIITNFTQVGGAEEMLIRYVNNIQNKKSIIISLMGISPLMTNKLQENVEVVCLNCNSAFDLLFSPIKLNKLLRKYQPNIIYSWMYHANFAAALTSFLYRIKIPVIWGVRHSLDDLSAEGVSTKLAIYAGKLFCNIPAKVIYCAERAMKQHIEFGYSTLENSIYIPNGYNFETSKVRCFDKSHWVFGAAGRFHEAKDYRTLFLAMAPILVKYSNANLRIAGRGITIKNHEIIQYIQDAGINIEQVELLGQVSNMPRFYNSIDFFILSSKTEGFPNVLAEAAGYGCVTFSTNAGDASIIVNDKQRVVEIGDYKGLTKSIEQVINYSSKKLNFRGKLSNF